MRNAVLARRELPPEPLFDSEAMTCVHEIYQRADAFLFGRRTYEVFAGYWVCSLTTSSTR